MALQQIVEQTVTGLGYDLVEIDRSAGGLLRITIDMPWDTAQVVEQFVQLKRAGIDGLQLSFFDFKPDLEFFGDRILPLMKQAGLRL